jgi:putative membrane protein
MQESSSRKGQLLPVSCASAIFALGGFAVILWLLYGNDFRAVLRAVAALSGGLAIVVVIRGIIVAVCGLAWWRLLTALTVVPLHVILVLRMVGEAVNVLLPVAAVGGDIVRTRLLSFSHVSGGHAVASALVDLLLEAAAQVLFALFGIALLMQTIGVTDIASWALGVLGIVALALGGFYAGQRFGGARILERGLGALARRWPATGLAGGIRLHDSLQTIHANRSAITIALLLHGLAWLLGSLEVWIASRLMGASISIAGALILESLSQGLRSAAFVVPSGLGVQEGGFVALGSLLGISPEIALALSFVKRVPDLAIGLPGLPAWYWLEMRRLATVPAVPPSPRAQPF